MCMQAWLHTQMHPHNGPCCSQGGDPSGGDVDVCIFVCVIRYSTFLLQSTLRPCATFAPIHQPDELCPFNITDSTGKKMNSDNIFICRLGLQSITSLETKGTVANGNCLWKQNVTATSDFPQRGLHSLLRMQREWMPALLSCTWPAAADVYCATVLQRPFSVTFHTLLPSIIVAVVRNLRHSELCVIHAPCYANMSATLFACRPSNINQMFTCTAWHLSFEVRVEN